MSDEAVIDAKEAEEMNEAMDYAQHQATWRNVTTMVKWAIVLLAFLVLGLYSFIIAGQPMVGGFLFLVGLLLIPGSLLFGKRS